MLTHKKEENRIEWVEDGITSFIAYRENEGKFMLHYSEVPVEARGGGVGRRLVNETLDYLENEGIEYVPICSFIKHVANRRKQKESE